MAVRRRRNRNEKRAREIDIRRDGTKGEGRYTIEKGKQVGQDASVRIMPNANIAKKKADEEAKKKKKPTNRRPKNGGADRGRGTIPPRANKVHLAKGVKYLMKKLKDTEGGINRKQAVTRAKRNITADRANRSYAGGFDWARDGVGAEDRDMGTKLNNVARRNMGKKRNITVRANVRGKKKMGTGKVLYKKRTTA